MFLSPLYTQLMNSLLLSFLYFSYNNLAQEPGQSSLEHISSPQMEISIVLSILILFICLNLFSTQLPPFQPHKEVYFHKLAH